jgi:fructan beta-fructosidase
LDRTHSGKVDFQEDFGGVQIMPVAQLPEGKYEVRILIDHSSIEVFINEGQYAMTAQLFPNEKYTDLTIENLGDTEFTLKDFQLNEIEGIW